MLWLQRIKRRTEGALYTVEFRLECLCKELKFRFRLLRERIPVMYLWEAFSYLAGLDMKEPMINGELSVHGYGIFLEIKRPGYHVTAQQNWRNQLVIQEWREGEREVKMEYGYVAKTHWHEIFRSGRHFEPEPTRRFIRQLRELYGDGPK